MWLTEILLLLVLSKEICQPGDVSIELSFRIQQKSATIVMVMFRSLIRLVIPLFNMIQRSHMTWHNYSSSPVSLLQRQMDRIITIYCTFTVSLFTSSAMLIEIQVAVSILKYTLVHSMSLEESFENYLNSLFDTDIKSVNFVFPLVCMKTLICM